MAIMVMIMTKLMVTQRGHILDTMERLIQPCPGQPPLHEWGTRSTKSVVWFHIEYSQHHIHILVRKVVSSVIQKQNSCKRKTLGTLVAMVMLMLVMVKTNWTRGPVLNVKHSIDALQSIAHQVHSLKSALLHWAGGPCLRSANCPLYFSLRNNNIY